VVPPSQFAEKDIQKFMRKTIGKSSLFRKKTLENVIGKNMVWMPYHKIQFDYKRSQRDSIQRYGETGQGETAFNAMFCGCVKSERELFVLFRPNYLKHEVTRHSPQSGEIVGPTSNADFDGVLGGLLKRLNEIRDELNEVRSELRKSRVQTSRFRMIMPVMWDLKKERTLSEKVARLSATKIALSMCLNVKEAINSIEITGNSIFHYPTLVATLKNKADEVETYLIINLADSGLTGKHLSYDTGLTKLCDKNTGCKEIIAKSITS